MIEIGLIFYAWTWRNILVLHQMKLVGCLDRSWSITTLRDLLFSPRTFLFYRLSIPSNLVIIFCQNALLLFLSIFPLLFSHFLFVLFNLLLLFQHLCSTMFDPRCTCLPQGRCQLAVLTDHCDPNRFL